MTRKEQIEQISAIAIAVRNEILRKYGTTAGKCIMASDTIEAKLKERGYDAHVKQVWCLYENFETCMDYCFEEHWVAYVLLGGHRLYIDVTMDQFQWAFSKELPQLYMQYRLPKFYLSKKPGKTTLDKCGWTSWYNTGNYENNFIYY